MRMRLDVVTLFLALILLAAAPVTGEEAGPQSDTAPAAQPADTVAEGAEGESMPCAAGTKCCGSAACAEAKRRSMEGKAAVADCPCKRNRAKPNHGG